MALEGTLSYLDIAHLLQVVGASKKSGVLEIKWEDRQARLFFQRGRLARAESNRFHVNIGTLLVEAGLLTREERDQALAAQRAESGVRRLGTLLCDDYSVNPQDIARLLRYQYEKIVYDVFSWPGGTFVFTFQEPHGAMDRFHLNPAEFIAGVGIQAGLLARGGVEREQTGGDKAALVLLLRDEEVRERCREHWQRMGHRVLCCDGEEAVMEHLLGPQTREPRQVVVADLLRPAAGGKGLLGGFELLDRIRSAGVDSAVVVVGESVDPKLRVIARSRGASAYVRKPLAQDLTGPHGDVHLDVFFMTLEKAVEMAAARLDDEVEEARA